MRRLRGQAELTHQQGLSSLSPHFCCQGFCFSSITHSQGPASQVTTLLSWCCWSWEEERRSTASAQTSLNVHPPKKKKSNKSQNPQFKYLIYRRKAFYYYSLQRACDLCPHCHTVLTETIPQTLVVHKQKTSLSLCSTVQMLLILIQQLSNSEKYFVFL